MRPCYPSVQCKQPIEDAIPEPENPSAAAPAKAPDPAKKKTPSFKREAWKHLPPADARRTQALNLLQCTKTSGAGYAALKFPAGYHSMDLGGTWVGGQRKPQERLAPVPYDFTGKTALDIGCNQGGMLFALSDKLRWGVGVDYDPRMVNAANCIGRTYHDSRFSFFNFNIDGDPHLLLRDYLPEPRVDIVFLLSVCRWVKRWRPLIRRCTEIADAMLFESNGSESQQSRQIERLRECYEDVQLISESSPDDPVRQDRMLLLARGPKDR